MVNFTLGVGRQTVLLGLLIGFSSVPLESLMPVGDDRGTRCSSLRPDKMDWFRCHKACWQQVDKHGALKERLLKASLQGKPLLQRRVSYWGSNCLGEMVTTFIWALNYGDSIYYRTGDNWGIRANFRAMDAEMIAE